jgi:hypothetical protein
MKKPGVSPGRRLSAPIDRKEGMPMSLESWAEGMLDKSFFARAMRKSTAKSVVLGWLDAIQNPNAVMSDIAGVEGEGTQSPPEKAIPVAPASPNQPVALPRPKLLSMPANGSADEPDRPGVPPRKVRKPKKQSPANGQGEALPADSLPTPGEVPE